MIIFISPAKGFTQTTLSPTQLPKQLSVTIRIIQELKNLSYSDFQLLLKTNEELTELNYQRYHNFKADMEGSPALFSYDGLQFKAMERHLWTNTEYDYVQNHLRIISGLYGILRPFDAIYPYRLEMQSRLPIAKAKNLYQFWGELLYLELHSQHEDIIVNLASDEYAKSIQKYVPKDQIYVTCQFKVWKNGKLKSFSTAAKHARGKMVHYLAKNQVQTLEGIQAFDYGGYIFSKEHSKLDTPHKEFVFIEKD